MPLSGTNSIGDSDSNAVSESLFLLSLSKTEGMAKWWTRTQILIVLCSEGQSAMNRSSGFQRHQLIGTLPDKHYEACSNDFYNKIMVHIKISKIARPSICRTSRSCTDGHVDSLTPRSKAISHLRPASSFKRKSLAE